MKYHFYKGTNFYKVTIPLLCWLFITVTQFSAGNVKAKDIDLDTEIAYLSAYNYAENYLSKSEARISFSLEKDIFDSSRIYAKTLLLNDFSGRLEVGDPYDNEPHSWGDRLSLNNSHDLQFELRELYWQVVGDTSLVRIGKQQTVWGKADGVVVLDLINPFRYREFVLEDSKDSRIAQWSTNVDLTFDAFTFQVVWIPDNTYGDFPNMQSEFAITSAQLVPRYPQPFPAQYKILRLDKPNDVIQNSDVALELGKSLGGWDVTLNYINQMANDPVFFRTIDYSQALPLVTVAATYTRVPTLGASASKSWGDLVMRTELAYRKNRYIIDYDVQDEDGAQKTDELNYVVGLDYFGFNSALLSAQIYQSHLMSYKNSLARERAVTLFTLLYQKSFFNDTLTCEGQWLTDQNGHDGLVRLSASYRMTDTYTLDIGVDTFYGDANGIFGQFDARDRVSFGLKAKF